jgi:hypothetical protein
MDIPLGGPTWQFTGRDPKHQIIVVMPAYNAAKTPKITYDAIPHQSIDQIILVDDGSTEALKEGAVGVSNASERTTEMGIKKENQSRSLMTAGVNYIQQSVPQGDLI